MAKMFYTLQETAEKLGIGEPDVKQLATSGKLQQFRDRDKLMFKRDQVDAIAAAKADDEEETADTGLSTGAIPLDDTGLSTGEIPMSAGSGSSDQIDLAAEDAAELPGAKKAKSEDSRMATGISVFDAGEIDEADPHTQTIVQPVEDEEELALESVGSGSGLLDLTQESDDTSLGAELLDEIYPTGEGSDLKVEHAGSSGAFEPAGAGASFAAGGGSGLDYAGGGGGAPVYIEAVEDTDPAGDGLGIGMLAVALVAMGACLFVALSAVLHKPIDLTYKLAGPGGLEDKTPFMYAGIAILAALILGIAGFFIGKSRKGAATE